MAEKATNKKIREGYLNPDDITTLGDWSCSCEGDCCGCICGREAMFFTMPFSDYHWLMVVEHRNY